MAGLVLACPGHPRGSACKRLCSIRSSSAAGRRGWPGQAWTSPTHDGEGGTSSFHSRCRTHKRPGADGAHRARDIRNRQAHSVTLHSTWAPRATSLPRGCGAARAISARPSLRWVPAAREWRREEGRRNDARCIAHMNRMQRHRNPRTATSRTKPRTHVAGHDADAVRRVAQGHVPAQAAALSATGDAQRAAAPSGATDPSRQAQARRAVQRRGVTP